MAAAAWRQWAARRQLCGSGGNAGSAAASAATLLPCAGVVATKTQAVIVVAGAQLPINNQLKVGAAMAREMTMTTATTMTMKTKGTAAAAAAAWRQWAARWKLGGSGGDGRSAAASTIKLPPCASAVAMMTPAATVVAGAQITINNQLKAGAATMRETMMTTETMMI